MLRTIHKSAQIAVVSREGRHEKMQKDDCRAWRQSAEIDRKRWCAIVVAIKVPMKFQPGVFIGTKCESQRMTLEDQCARHKCGTVNIPGWA
jgi:hypothetical protein